MLGVAVLAPGGSACKREADLGGMRVDKPASAADGRGDEAFLLAWKDLGEAEVFYIEDDRGDGLMGRVRRARKEVPQVPVETGAGGAPAPAAGAPPAETALPETLSYDDISPIVRRQLGSVKSCYLRLSQRGSTRSGRAILSFTVEAGGSVDDVRIDAPAFRDTDLPSCVSKLVERWSFPPSQKGGLAVSYPLVFVGG